MQQFIFKLSKFSNKSLLLIIILFILTIPTLLPLFKQGFFPTQDYIYVARIYQMDKALKDGQFPVRWVPDFRYGEPLYNFYAPLAYYIGSLIKTFGFSFLNTTKILFGIGFLLSGITMFLLAKELFGKLGGLVAAVLYIYAPYHSVDVYVRGALSESWALIFFPLIFLFSFKLVQKKTNQDLPLLSLSLAGLFFTHSIMTVLFLPFFFFWIIFLIWSKKQIGSVKHLFLALILGFGLASSFLLPAFVEKEFVQSKYLLTGYFDFRGHFVTIPEFFSTFWGYGASLWGPKDDMSFQVGLVHWVVFVLSLVMAIILRKDKKILYLILFLSSSYLFSLFMQHNKSAFIWERFSSVLAYIQFPWRFLGISIFLSSLLGGSLAMILKNKLSMFIPLLIIVTIITYIGFFHPESYYYDSLDSHYISKEILSKDDRLPKDYLPIYVKEIPSEKLIAPIAKEGQIKVLSFDKRSSSAKVEIEVLKDATVEIPITYFPGWSAVSDGKSLKIEEPSKLGLIVLKLTQGKHAINLKFSNTPIRLLGNILSLISIFILLGINIKSTKKYEKNI